MKSAAKQPTKAVFAPGGVQTAFEREVQTSSGVVTVVDGAIHLYLLIGDVTFFATVFVAWVGTKLEKVLLPQETERLGTTKGNGSGRRG